MIFLFELYINPARYENDNDSCVSVGLNVSLLCEGRDFGFYQFAGKMMSIRIFNGCKLVIFTNVNMNIWNGKAPMTAVSPETGYVLWKGKRHSGPDKLFSPQYSRRFVSR